MLTIEKTEVYGWEASIRGLRNPMNSWDMSDSVWMPETPRVNIYGETVEIVPAHYTIICNLTNKSDSHWGLAEGEVDYDGKLAYYIGENDLKLMQTLSKAGSDHGKFLRMINVTCDITAPLYWWKEFDTYKVGTVANSCSTMHKIHAKEFTLDDFSHEHLIELEVVDGEQFSTLDYLKLLVTRLNLCRKKYLETKDKIYWWQMIQLLPSSYNQKRTVQLNYQVLKQMYFARRNHKLDEWHTLCEWMESLPYFLEVVIQE